MTIKSKQTGTRRSIEAMKKKVESLVGTNGESSAIFYINAAVNAYNAGEQSIANKEDPVIAEHEFGVARSALAAVHTIYKRTRKSRRAR